MKYLGVENKIIIFAQKKHQIGWNLRISTFVRNKFTTEFNHRTMLNNDFWHSIKQIIDNGFDAEGLSKLEFYAEPFWWVKRAENAWILCLDKKRKNEIQQFISNRLVYERFSPFEQHGCSAGGTTHVIATLLAGAEVDADSLTAPINSFQGEQMTFIQWCQIANTYA